MRRASCIAAAAAVSAEPVTVGPDAFGYVANDEAAFACLARYVRRRRV